MAAVVGFVAGVAASTFYSLGKPHPTWASVKTFWGHTQRTCVLSSVGLFFAAKVVDAGPTYKNGPHRHKPVPAAWGMGLATLLIYGGAVGMAATRFSNRLGTPREAAASVIATGLLGLAGLYLSQ